MACAMDRGSSSTLLIPRNSPERLALSLRAAFAEFEERPCGLFGAVR
jgi:hypothetical protein